MPGLTESGRKNEQNIEEWQKGHEFCVQGRNQTKRGVLPWFKEQRQEDVQVRACFHFAMAQRARGIVRLQGKLVWTEGASTSSPHMEICSVSYSCSVSSSFGCALIGLITVLLLWRHSLTKALLYKKVFMWDFLIVSKSTNISQHFPSFCLNRKERFSL